MNFDCLVLGAGMVGISAALHLQARGRSVALVDRKGPAQETSFGNTGLIEVDGAWPLMFPRDWRVILDHALNRRPEAHVQWGELPKTAPALLRYYLASSPGPAAHSAQALAVLTNAALAAHNELIQASGAEALIRRTGYLRLYRSHEKLDHALEDHRAATAATGASGIEALDEKGLSALEPHLKGSLAGALYYKGSASCIDPSALGAAYAQLFKQRGGVLLTGDACTLEPEPQGGWRIGNMDGAVTARDVVLALGPWTADLLRGFGVSVPMFAKRGYHMHYKPTGNATLGRVMIDVEGGFAVSHMSRGIRVTTGAEFASHDAKASPVPLSKVEPLARAVLPIAERLDPKPWLGARPCLPDMLPMIGAVPGHKGLYVDTGHNHLGFTLGPVSGRLLADLVTGVTPFVDAAPYRVARF